MLANLSLSGCYKSGVMSAEARDRTMLKSAKVNLRRMAFFGLTEFQPETQYLFEQTFGLKFRRDFVQYNHTHAKDVDISARQQNEILRTNQLDGELYQYARDLFFRRLENVLKEQSAVGTKDLGYETNPRPDIRWGIDEKAVTNVNAILDGEEYEESDDDDVDDDKDYNHRIAEQRRRTGRMWAIFREAR